MTLADPAPLSWGVIGATSWVAVKAVIPAIVGSPRARLVAVASQSANAPSSADGSNSASAASVKVPSGPRYA